MPMVDIRIAITVGAPQGTSGSPDQAMFTIAQNAQPGLALTPAQQTRLKDAIVAMVTQVENYGQAL